MVERNWRYFEKFVLCLDHKLKFKNGSECPECSIEYIDIPKKYTIPNLLHSDIPISATSIKSVSKGNEGSLSVKREQKKSKTHPASSVGDSKNANVEVSSKISGKRAVQSGSRAVGSGMFSGKRKIYERFHNYRLKFVADVDWDSISGIPIRLGGGVLFKRLYFENASVQVFRKSILVILRASKEIKGLPISEAKKKADNMLLEVLNALPGYIRIKDDGKVRALHNAFVNHPTALHDVRVVVNGETRLITDNSKGNMEFEAVSPEFAVPDSKILENWNEDLITSPFDLPSITKKKLDIILGVQERYAFQIAKHLEVQDKTLETLNDISRSVKAQIGGGKSSPNDCPYIRPSLENLGRGDISHKQPPTMSDSLPIISKYDSLSIQKLKKARYYLSVFGW